MSIFKMKIVIEIPIALKLAIASFRAMGGKNEQPIQKDSGQAGFILLMSSIVISAILVAVVLSLSFSGFFTRFNLLDSYNKEASLKLAEACGDIAVLKKVQDSSYDGDEYMNIGFDECYIRPIVGLTIETTASKSGAVSNVIVNLDSSTPPNAIRWREASNF